MPSGIKPLHGPILTSQTSCGVHLRVILQFAPNLRPQGIIPYHKFQNYTFKITATSPRGQWVILFHTSNMVGALQFNTHCVCLGTFLGMGSANDRRYHNVMSSLIGWAHTQNDPWCWSMDAVAHRTCRICWTLWNTVWESQQVHIDGYAKTVINPLVNTGDSAI